MTQSSRPANDDVFIAVMGVTGAGKSTFINHCTENQVKIGHDLQACTQEVEVYKSSLFPDKNVYLVDTPGFDDTNRTDKEVLKEIATWLGIAYEQKVQLSGIIYLHRITDTRMQGSAKKNLLMFKKLCGPEALQRVILATTMWERLPDEGMGMKREKELVETEEFWGWMTRQGSQVRRHYNTENSARDLLKIFVTSNQASVTLKIQEEIVDKNKELNETSAGIELDSALIAEKEKYRREIEEMKFEMGEALAMRDNDTAAIIRQSQQEVLDKIKTIDRDREDLKVSFETMYQERVANLESKVHEQQQAIIRQNQQEVLDRIKTIDRDREDLKVSFETMYQERVANLESKVREQQQANERMRSSMEGMIRSIWLERQKASTSYDASRMKDNYGNHNSTSYDKPRTKDNYGKYDNTSYDTPRTKDNYGKYDNTSYDKPKTKKNYGKHKSYKEQMFFCSCGQGFPDEDFLFEHLEEHEEFGEPIELILEFHRSSRRH